MTYEEALQILFKNNGRFATFLWLDINSPSHEEVIKEATQYNH